MRRASGAERVRRIPAVAHASTTCMSARVRGAGAGKGANGPAPTQDISPAARTAVSAAALQAHFAGQLSLTPRRRVGKPAGPLTSTRVSRTTDVASVSSSVSSASLSRSAAAWTSSSSALLPSSTSSSSSSLLAQRLGLVPAPPAKLSEHEWEQVRQTAVARRFHEEPCAICHDEYRMQDQVLLSCSHTFHRACLASYERFAETRSCPMCRKESYEKRRVTDAAAAYQQRCAVKIQAAWRGHRVRREYLRLLQQHGPRDPKARQAWARDRLCRLMDTLVTHLDAHQRSVDQLLASSDASIARARRIMADSAMHESMTPELWNQAQLAALVRDDTECSICLQRLRHRDRLAKAADKARRGQASSEPSSSSKALTLLSCTHVFHDACLTAFEGFAAPGDALTCPLCRAEYCRRAWA